MVLNPHNSPLGLVLLAPSHSRGNKDSDTFSHLSKVTQLGCGRVKNQTCVSHVPAFFTSPSFVAIFAHMQKHPWLFPTSPSKFPPKRLTRTGTGQSPGSLAESVFWASGSHAWCWDATQQNYLELLNYLGSTPDLLKHSLWG